MDHEEHEPGDAEDGGGYGIRKPTSIVVKVQWIDHRETDCIQDPDEIY